MADVTIKGLVSKAAPASGDLLALWDEGGQTTKKLDALYYEPRDATILKNAAIGVTVSSQNHIHEGDALNASGITDGYILTADGAGNAVWEANAGASNAFNDLTDVTITSPATGNIPRWNGSAWVNYPDSNYATSSQGSLADSALQNLTSVSIKTLSDVYTTMSPSQGQVLTYNTTNGWQAETPSTGAATALNDLSDVALDGTPGVDELLAYDGSNFVNQTAAEAGLATVTHVHEGTTIDSTGVTSGYVLTADGVGNASWLVPSGAGHVIEDEGSAVTARSTLNFVGAGVAVTDVGGKTTVTVNDMSESINVKSYGAVGDGTTDDTAAIQAAVDAAIAAAGAIVFVPTGQYKITSPIKLFRVRLIGEMMDFGCAIRPYGCAAFSIEGDDGGIYASGNWCFRVGIENIMIWADNASTDEGVIVMRGAYQVDVEKVWVYEIPTDMAGIYLGTTANAGGCNDINITRLVAYSKSGATGNHGISINGACTVTVHNPDLEALITGIETVLTGGNATTQVNIYGLYAERCQTTIKHAFGEMSIFGGRASQNNATIFASVRCDHFHVYGTTILGYAPSWAATTTYNIGDIVQITGGTRGRCVGTLDSDVAEPGTSGSSEPTLSSTLGETVVDGTTNWQKLPYNIGSSGKIDFYAEGIQYEDIILSGISPLMVNNWGRVPALNERWGGIFNKEITHAKYLQDNVETTMSKITIWSNYINHTVLAFECTIFTGRAGYGSALKKYAFFLTSRAGAVHVVGTLKELYVFMENDSANYTIESLDLVLNTTTPTDEILLDVTCSVSGSLSNTKDTEVYMELKCLSNTSGLRIDML